jgi:hypothetical protein
MGLLAFALGLSALPLLPALLQVRRWPMMLGRLMLPAAASA